jgi:non-ribosomal peptide synthetase component F/acyl carrier protein
MSSDTVAPPGLREPAATRLPATGKEKAMWLVEKLDPGTAANNLAVALQVGGRLRGEALRPALAIVLGRYEALRTVFHASGAELFKQVLPAGEFGIEIEPLELPGEHPEQQLSAFVDRPFSFDGSPLVRIATAERPDGDILCVAVHHLAFDMVSMALFVEAFVSVYEAVAAGRPVPAAPPAAAFAEPEPKPADLDYWRETLGGVTPGGLDLWCGLPRGRRPAMTGESLGHDLSPEAQRAVLELQRSARAPLAAVLLAAYAALLAAHGAGPDLVISAPFDVRGPNAAAIGYHVNVLPLRITVDFAEGLRTLIRKSRDTFLGAMAHAHTSVDELAGRLPGFEQSAQRGLSRHLFNFLPAMALGELTVDGMPARLLPIENAYSKFDLELVGTHSSSEVLFRYSREILPRAEVRALLRRFEALLIAAAQDPDRALAEIAGWSAADRETVDRANETAGRPPYPVVPDAFAARAAQAPQAIAVAEGERTLSYQDVHERAEAVRSLLAGAGIRAADVVAAAVPRAQLPAAALGVWRAGAVLLPLDPGHHSGWLTRQLAHARPAAVLTGSKADLADLELPLVLPLESAPEPGAVTAVADLPIAPDTAACLIVSCGDDGQPASTLLSHVGIADTAGHLAAELGVEPGTGVLSLAGPGSLGAILDLSLALSVGGRIVLADEQATTGGTALREAVDRHGPSVVLVPPGIPARILEDLAERLAGLTVLVPGQEIARDTAARLQAAGCRLHSAYGTEATTGWALTGRADTPDCVAGGGPITRTHAFITAPDGRGLPVGVRGELRFAGTGLALDTPGEDAFPVDGRYGRNHRTGMLARRRPDGSIELLGLIGRQIATPDGPVDLGQVEAVLLDHSGVAAAAAVPVELPGQGTAIVAFAEHADTGDDAAALLLAHATAGLAAHAVPRRIVRLDALPRTEDGRPDRQALRSLGEKALDEQSAPDPAADDALCTDLIGLWRTLLQTVEVTAQTHFFDAGGHSLLAAVLADRIEELTGLTLQLNEIFEHPTPAALAARLRG